MCARLKGSSNYILYYFKIEFYFINATVRFMYKYYNVCQLLINVILMFNHIYYFKENFVLIELSSIYIPLYLSLS